MSLVCPHKQALLEIAELLDTNCVRYFIHDEPDDNIGDAALCTEQITGAMRSLFRRHKLWAA